MTGAGQGDDQRSRALREVEIARRSGARQDAARDAVAVEEPLEVRLGDHRLLVTMRTPGDDFDLVRGLLYTDAFVAAPDDVVGLRYCDDVAPEHRGNVVSVALREGIDPAALIERRVQVASAACGVCGRRSLDDLAIAAPPIADPARPTIAAATLATLVDRMREGQRVFEGTGGLHAAALFDLSGGEARRAAVHEDVGRHNAVDKVIGAACRFSLLPLSEHLVLVSGRAGFEIAQKVRRAGVPILASVSAPSSLAIDVCAEGGMTLIGFLRGDAFNVYCGEERVR